jgi:DNA gyrase inhibitor GyrI
MKKITGMILLGCIAFLGIVTGQEKTQPAGAAVVAAAADTVVLSKVAPYSYCALEMRGSFDQHGAAFQNLYQQAGMQGLPGTAVPFGIYWNSPQDTPVDSLKWELGFALPEARTLAAPLVLKKWEFPLVATLTFEGVYGSEAQAAATGKLFEWIGKNGYRPAGPMMERFVTMPAQTADGGFSGRVEMVIPVAPVK